MIKESEMKFLKMFVYAMGIVMMIGIMIITYTIYKRNILLDENSSSVMLSCNKNNSVYLPRGKVVNNASIAGDILSLLTNDNEILIYDHCTGKLQKTIKLVQK